MIVSDKFIDWIRSIGIDPTNTNRVIVDAKAGYPIKIYVEMYGDEPMVKADLPDELKTGIIIKAENLNIVRE